ncbi:MAG: hypothetical protein ABR990_04615 [Terracidiphilus sp.]|jgi:hypothetical protein
MPEKPNRIIDMDESKVLLKILAHADKEIEAVETVSIEDGYERIWRGSL